MSSPVNPLRTTAIAASLRRCSLFAELPAGDLEEIAGFSQLKSLSKGEYLFREGEPTQGFYVVQRGSVNVHRVSPLGREQVIHIFHAGASFAEATLAPGVVYPADARAVDDCSVVLVPKPPFVALLARRPELVLQMLAAMSMHLRTLVDVLEDMRLKDVETRLIHWLLKRCDRRGPAAQDIPLKSTKRMLAAELNTSSETLSRTFARLRKEELLLVKGKVLRVTDQSLLDQRFRRLLGESVREA